MAKKMTRAALFFMIGTVILIVFYKKTAYGPVLSLAITFGTVSYHLVMRLLVGGAFQAVMQNHADLRKRWYRVGRREMAVYEALKVKRWKRRMPTYDNALFDPRLHTWDEVAQACARRSWSMKRSRCSAFCPLRRGSGLAHTRYSS